MKDLPPCPPFSFLSAPTWTLSTRFRRAKCLRWYQRIAINAFAFFFLKKSGNHRPLRYNEGKCFCFGLRKTRLLPFPPPHPSVFAPPSPHHPSMKRKSSNPSPYPAVIDTKFQPQVPYTHAHTRYAGLRKYRLKRW